MLTLLQTFGVLLLPAMRAGCSSMGAAPAGSGQAASPPNVTGTVTYLQRIALPPDAMITVQLVDVSRADVPALVLGEQIIRAGGGQVPFEFEIAYDSARIDPRMTYAVSARIEDSGKLLFISDQHCAVITRGAPAHVQMVLKPVGAAPR